jgi:hypothetical protein
VNTLTSYERQFGTSTYSVQGKLRLKNHEAITFDNMFAGENAASNTSAYVIAPITALVNNDYESVDMEGLEISVKSTEQPRTATLERVWIDDPRPRPGRTIPVKVLLRSYRGEDIIQTIPIEIPANAKGNLALMVSDGQLSTRPSSAKPGSRSRAASTQLVRALNKARRNNTICVKLLGSDAGAVVSGELLSSLPPSVLAVLESDRSSGNVNPLQTATLGEWQLRTEQAISGVARSRFNCRRTDARRSPLAETYDGHFPVRAAGACRRRSLCLRSEIAHRFVAEVLRRRHAGRLSQGRPRESVPRCARPADPRSCVRTGL